MDDWIRDMTHVDSNVYHDDIVGQAIVKSLRVKEEDKW